MLFTDPTKTLTLSLSDSQARMPSRNRRARQAMEWVATEGEPPAGCKPPHAPKRPGARPQFSPC